jgi:hypothetical protein
LGSKSVNLEPVIKKRDLVRIRTLNLLIRSQMLYPIELRNRFQPSFTINGRKDTIVFRFTKPFDKCFFFF